MSEELSMDPAVMEAQAAEVRVPVAADPWLERRKLTFGASEIPALVLALGWPFEKGETPAYVIDNARSLIAVKAGLRKAPKVGRAADKGNEVEVPILEAFNDDPTSGWERAEHSSRVPREWLPLVDRECPKLSCTPDSWVYRDGQLWNVQVKATMRNRAYVPWYWHAQVQAEMAVTGAVGSIVLIGERWAAWHNDAGPVTPHIVERDDRLIEHIREMVRVGWAKVEAMKESARADS